MVSKVAEALGGKLDLMLFGFGERDVIGVLDLPDTVSAASATLAASGPPLLSSVCLLRAVAAQALGVSIGRVRLISPSNGGSPRWLTTPPLWACAPIAVGGY